MDKKKYGNRQTVRQREREKERKREKNEREMRISEGGGGGGGWSCRTPLNRSHRPRRSGTAGSTHLPPSRPCNFRPPTNSKCRRELPVSLWNSVQVHTHLHTHSAAITQRSITQLIKHTANHRSRDDWAVNSINYWYDGSKTFSKLM